MEDDGRRGGERPGAGAAGVEAVGGHLCCAAGECLDSGSLEAYYRLCNETAMMEVDGR